jgi:hypothetical protein
MTIRPRDVIRIWDRYTSPNKVKLHICVCDQRQLFLRINSDPAFAPTYPLLKRDNPFLHHDSHVELQQLVRHMAEEIRDAERIGRISPSVAKALVAAAADAPTFSPEHKRLIAERLL